MTQSTLNDHQDSDRDGYKDPKLLRRLYHDKGLTQSEIGEMFGVSHGAVQNYIRKYNIQTIPRGEQQKKKRATHVIRTDGYEAWRNENDEVLVHRLLAISEYGFDAVCDNEVHHKSNVPWDNRPENIELMSKSEHQSHHSTGEDNSNSKLVESEVREIKRLLRDTNLRHKDIADKFGITAANVTHINCGRYWEYVDPP